MILYYLIEPCARFKSLLLPVLPHLFITNHVRDFQFVSLYIYSLCPQTQLQNDIPYVYHKIFTQLSCLDVLNWFALNFFCWMVFNKIFNTYLSKVCKIFKSFLFYKKNDPNYFLNFYLLYFKKIIWEYILASYRPASIIF